jgi:predicted pyridoxine 5'-phosphate oxidase superfamily flavin-nucleotide-binding protein
MARVVRIEDDPRFVQSLTIGGYDAVVEAAITFTVSAFDWNCPQHIPRRVTLDQIEEHTAALRDRITQLEAENAALRRASSSERN